MKTLILILMVGLMAGCGNGSGSSSQDLSGNYTGTMNGKSATAFVSQSGGLLLALIQMSDGETAEIQETVTPGSVGQPQVLGPPACQVGSPTPCPEQGPCGPWTISSSTVQINGDEITGTISGTTGSCGALDPTFTLTYASASTN